MAMKYVIALQPYHIGVIFRFKKTINLRICKASIATEEPRGVRGSVTGNDGFQDVLPVVGTMNISIAKRSLLHIAKLIETKQRVITGASKIAIVSSALLIAIGWTDRTVHIKDNLLE